MSSEEVKTGTREVNKSDQSQETAIQPEDTKKEEKKVEGISNAPKSAEQHEQEKVAKMIAKSEKGNVGELLKRLQPIFDTVSNIFDKVFPPIQKAVVTGIDIYNKLPMDVIYALIGLILAFFGGSFALTLVALEAFYNSGYETVRYNAEQLYFELKELWKKSREDDQVDEDKDGVADVLQGSTKDLVTRKIAFFFTNVKDPKKIMDMISGIGNCFIAVLAVLKIDFAKVIALGNSIGDNLKKPAQVYLVPILSSLLPEKFHQWISPVINYTCKIIAISIAMVIQRVISAVQSGIRGGLMFSRRLLKYLNDKGHISFNEDESSLDEIIGWAVAFIGVYFQIMNAFSIPFPINLILFPCTFLENLLTWAVATN